MQIFNFFNANWSRNKNLSAWEAHQRKQLLRKIVTGTIVLFYILAGAMIYLYESGSFDRSKPIVVSDDGKAVQVELREVVLLPPEPSVQPPIKDDSNLEKEDNASIVLPATQERETTELAEVVAPIAPDEFFVTEEKEIEKCGTLILMPEKNKELTNSSSYWHTPIVDIEYADKIKSYYGGCVSEYLEQPYATAALAISAICAYQQGGPTDYNFLGKDVWGVRKFENASEFFEEFSLVYNPAKIENSYFDKFQESEIPLVEQFWRAYLEKFFPEVHPKAVKELMVRWGYDYTNI